MATSARARKPVLSTPTTSQSPVEENSAEDRIRELEEKLRLVEENAERRIREIEEAASNQKPQPADSAYSDQEGDVILLHFVEDGFTTQGRVWYRGQELQFVVGSDAYNDTLDRNGSTWVSWTEAEQVAKKGTVYFRRGPWPGKKYTDGEWVKDAPPVNELERADKLERDRRRSVPRLPDIQDESS